LVTGREVYSGGGIIPDVFVPVDTTGTSPYFLALVRKGIMNRFALEYVNKNRVWLDSNYSDFKVYQESFDMQNALSQMIQYATDKNLTYKEDEFSQAEEAITVRLKALIAQNYWGFSEFYQIFNELNPIYKKGIELISNKQEYKQLDLSKKY